MIGRRIIGTVGFMGGVPAVLSKFWWSSLQMTVYTGETLGSGVDCVEYVNASFSEHSAARNWLASRVRGDWIIMLDTDHQPEPDLITRLVYWADEGECDVLVGAYTYKYPPFLPVIYVWDEKTGFPTPITNWDPDATLLRVGSAGGGCLFIRRSVFQRMKEEWPKEGPFSHRDGMGEDHSFFKRCQKLDIPVWCHMGIENPHLRVVPTTLHDFESESVDSSFNRVSVEGLR